ncbi:ATP-binding protein [Streptomyces sp. NPDC007872]|uniref:ATP-binding protein n=1 Tax=Streptomyces sp. NPDC007872 TaxID=3364782 RepID=UPI0036808042
MTTTAGADDDDCAVPEDDLMQVGHAWDEGEGLVAEARDRATAFLEKARTVWGVPVSERAEELTRLVVSELVTNARRHAPGPVLLQLRIGAGTVDVVVWDSEPTVPAAHAADPDRVGQHGLEIVQAVARELRVRREPVGKRVTARVDLD